MATRKRSAGGGAGLLPMKNPATVGAGGPRRFGWIPDLPDPRDQMYAMHRSRFDELPPRSSVDDSGCLPDVLDQGNLGSCTANAIANAHEYLQRLRVKAAGPGAALATMRPSRLFIYYNERSMEGTIQEDAGAMIRDGIKSVARHGVCSETAWPYNIAAFRAAPPRKCYTKALSHQALSYARVDGRSLLQIKSCIAEGFPIVFGFTVLTSFVTDAVAKTGIMPMPQRGDRALGGHAVLAVGYDDASQCIIVQNSWGDAWGRRGFFFMPYAYITSDLADDFWTIREAEVPPF